MVNEQRESYSGERFRGGRGEFDGLDINNYATLSATTGDVIRSDGERFDPADYGGSVADAANAAINQGTNNQRTVVQLPPNVTIEDTIVFDNSRACLRGHGWGSEILFRPGSDGAAIRVEGPVNNSQIRDLFIQGPGDGAATTNDALRFDTSTGDTPRNWVQNCIFSKFSRNAVRVDGGGDAFENTVDQVHVRDIGESAFRTVDPTDVAGFTLSRCTTYSGTIGGDFAQIIGPGINKQVVQCVIEPGVQTRGIFISDGRNAKVHRNKIEGTGASAIIMNGVKNSSVVANTFFNIDSGFLFRTTTGASGIHTLYSCFDSGSSATPLDNNGGKILGVGNDIGATSFDRTL